VRRLIELGTLGKRKRKTNESMLVVASTIVTLLCTTGDHEFVVDANERRVSLYVVGQPHRDGQGLAVVPLRTRTNAR